MSGWDRSSLFSEFNYTQWESKEIFEQRFLEKLDDEQVNASTDRFHQTNVYSFFLVQNDDHLFESFGKTSVSLYNQRLY